MRTRTFCAVAIGLLSLALTSCQNDLDLLKPSQYSEPENTTQLGSSIADGLVAHPSEGFYIIYSSSSDEFITLSEEDYSLFAAFANLVVREDSNSNGLRSAKPAGDGWKFGGKGKGKLDAIRIGYELSDLLEEHQDFEIYVEYNADGSYTVWYREVKKSSKGSNP
jgi:hypothetical protein